MVPLTFAFLLQPITFVLTDCSYHCSLIPIQCSKNKNFKTEISPITNPFSSIFIYKKREERDKERKKKERREKRDRKNKNRNSTISTSNGHIFL
jgi:hypothetical protein